MKLNQSQIILLSPLFQLDIYYGNMLQIFNVISKGSRIERFESTAAVQFEGPSYFQLYSTQVTQHKSRDIFPMGRNTTWVHD